MDKKKVTIVWTLYENEGYWQYTFGSKNGLMKTSPRLMTKERAIKSFENEIELAKRQYGSNYEVVVEKI